MVGSGGSEWLRRDSLFVTRFPYRFGVTYTPEGRTLASHSDRNDFRAFQRTRIRTVSGVHTLLTIRQVCYEVTSLHDARREHTMTSNWSGVDASCMHVLSTIISLYVMVGNSFATARHSCTPEQPVSNPTYISCDLQLHIGSRNRSQNDTIMMEH